MPFEYELKWTDDQVGANPLKPRFFVNPNEVNGPGNTFSDTTLQLPGKFTPNYGEYINTNYIHLMEHFSGPTEPVNPTSGMIWFDSDDNLGDGILKYRSTPNSAWQVISGSFLPGAVVLGPDTTGDYVEDLTQGIGVTIVGGTGDGSNPTISIGQPISITDDVTFNDMLINGNLTVVGNTTEIESNVVNIGDSIITLNSDEVGTPSQSGGIEIERGTSTNVQFVWDETVDRWKYHTDGSAAAFRFLPNQDLDTTSTPTFSSVTASVIGNASSATQLQTSRTFNISGTDITGTAQNFDGTTNVNIPATVNVASTLRNNRTFDVTGTDVTTTSQNFNGSGNVNIPIVINTATQLRAPRTFNVTGSDVTGTLQNFDGTANVSIPVIINTATQLRTQRTFNVTGSDVTGTLQNFNGTANVSIPVIINTATKLRTARSFNLSGSDVTGTSQGFDGTTNVDIPVVINTATKLRTARTFDLSGDVTATGQTFDGTGNVTVPVTVDVSTKLRTVRTFTLSGDVTGTVENFDGTGNVNIVTTSGGGGAGDAWIDQPSSAFTATAGGNYFIDTSAGPVNISLPASPSTGDTVAFCDATSTWDINSLFVGRNGQLIMGLTQDMENNVVNNAFRMGFSASFGWRIIV